VCSIVNFGAFVDVGVGRDGLVHISELSEEHVARVEEVVRAGQRVRVKVLSVEQREGKWRIGLTMKGVEQ
jgi:predicted RNA-binding protein with RPS1 domain